VYHPKNDARVKVITAGNEYIMFQMGNLHGRWPGEPLKISKKSGYRFETHGQGTA
jgi:hypothetical protein